MGRNVFYVNGDGYFDGTAGKALQNINREECRKERIENMAKKRNCRRTAEENIIHEKAVKWRKMTDEQLVHYVEDRVEKARSEGFNKGKVQTLKQKPFNIEDLLTEIGKVKGIGSAKLNDIREILEKKLKIEGKTGDING